MDARRVEDRQVEVAGLDQQPDLGAAEDDPVGAGAAQPIDLSEAGGLGLWNHHAAAEFLVDDPVDEAATDLIGYPRLGAVAIARPAPSAAGPDDALVAFVGWRA